MPVKSVLDSATACDGQRAHQRQSEHRVSAHTPVHVGQGVRHQGGAEGQEDQQRQELSFGFAEFVQRFADVAGGVAEGETRHEGGDEPVAADELGGPESQ